jgi:hypothetical protein
VLSQWNKIKTWPGIAEIIKRFSRRRIRKADPEIFTVLVADLEDDIDGSYKKLIIENLKESCWIEV